MFPNPAHFTDEPPQWRPVADKPGVWKHDDNDSCCEAELFAFWCDDCEGLINWGQRRLGTCDHGEPPDDKEFLEKHARCSKCGQIGRRVEHRADGSPILPEVSTPSRLYDIPESI